MRRVVVNDLFDARWNEDEVDAAKAELNEYNESIDGESSGNKSNGSSSLLVPVTDLPTLA